MTCVCFFQVPNIIDSLEMVYNKGEVHSAIIDFEALNVIIRYAFKCLKNWDSDFGFKYEKH